MAACQVIQAIVSQCDLLHLRVVPQQVARDAHVQSRLELWHFSASSFVISECRTERVHGVLVRAR